MSRKTEIGQYLSSNQDDKIIALPLQFEYLPVEILSKEFTKLNSPHPYRIHYLGPRFTNTLVLHKKYSATSPLNQNQQNPFLFQEIMQYPKYDVQLKKIVQSNYLNEKLQNNHYYKSAIFYRAFEGMNPTLNRDSQILFNSCFEAGNLDCAIKVNPTQFDLFLRIDSNTRGHTQWFYFSVSNGKKTGSLTFNICNLTKANTLYDQGMRPYVFSKQKFEKYGKSWEQSGQNVELCEKKFRYSLVEEMIDPPTVHRLSFDYHFQEENDEVFFAYSIPYTYSQMLSDIGKLPKQYVQKHILGRSLTGVDIPILHISNHTQSENQGKKDGKKNVLITGRIHPGESNGSHVLKGVIEFLCGNTEQAGELRKRMNFFIIPMVNPDGVIMGNSRSSASGKDLNRQYLGTKKELYPQVYLVKNLAIKLQKGEGLMMFFDFHGHSRKKNTFFYGPGYSISEPEYYKSRAFAKIIEKVNNSFRYYSCSFMISEQKKRTARAVLFDQIKIPYVFTIESSIGLYYDCGKLKTLEFTIQDWNNMGINITQGLCDFIIAYEEYEEIIRERRLERKRKKQKFSELKKNSTKKFAEQESDKEEESIVNKQKKQPSMLMFDLVEEIRQAPSHKADLQVSSDDHDEAQNLETSKLAEFNNLIIYSKQKDLMNSTNRLAKVVQEVDEMILKPKKLDTETDQLQLVKQITQKTKVSSIKVSKTISPSKPTTQNISIARVPPVEKKLIKKNHSYGSKSMKLVEQEVQPKFLRQQCRKRKSVNFQTHRHLISKQFFPLDKCQIVELPKSSIGGRKDIKKGRVMIQEYLNDKLKEKQQRERQEVVKLKEKQTISMNRKSRNSSLLPVQEAGGKTGKMKKFQIEDLNRYRNKSSGTSSNKFMDRKVMLHNPSFNSTVKKDTVKIFDPVMFSGFQGMEIDNMAMMIRTFNK